jgi:hypothetical protein
MVTCIIGTAFPSRVGGMSWDCHQALSRLQPSLSCRPSCCAARRRRKSERTPPSRFPASRSTRQSRWRGQIVRSRRQIQRHPAGDRQPLTRRPLERRRLRRIQSWAGFPSWRKSPAIATAVANQAFHTAKTLGSGVASRGADKQLHLFRQRAGTTSPTNPTWIASRPRCSWASTEIEPGGFAAACRPPGSFKSPNSSDRDSRARPLVQRADLIADRSIGPGADIAPISDTCQAPWRP